MDSIPRSVRVFRGQAREAWARAVASRPGDGSVAPPPCASSLSTCHTPSDGTNPRCSRCLFHFVVYKDGIGPWPPTSSFRLHAAALWLTRTPHQCQSEMHRSLLFPSELVDHLNVSTDLSSVRSCRGVLDMPSAEICPRRFSVFEGVGLVSVSLQCQLQSAPLEGLRHRIFSGETSSLAKRTDA